MSYIVKNCPAYILKSCSCETPSTTACVYRPKCVIKRIIETCKEFENLKDGDAINVGQSYAALAILQTLEIEDIK